MRLNTYKLLSSLQCSVILILDDLNFTFTISEHQVETQSKFQFGWLKHRIVEIGNVASNPFMVNHLK